MKKSNAQHPHRFFELTGYRFKDKQLLLLALTHSSHQAGGQKDYQRLEFFGDRILGMVIAEHLYVVEPDADEGTMARQFTFLVRKGTCTSVAKDIGLGELLRAGPSINGRHVKSNSRMLGDACEAVLAAVYLDGGFEAVRAFILRFWQPYFDKAIAAPRDSKTRLQEWALAKGLAIPKYVEISREGPDHEPLFVIEVRIEGYEPASGQASSKRRGEQVAAENFITRQRIKQK